MHFPVAASFLRHLPARLADSIYWRVYSRRQHLAKYNPLFESAILTAGPGVTMTLDSKDHMHGMIAFTGTYERGLTDEIKSLARRGGLLVDVGANWGYYTLLWAAANPANKVIAIEASPRNTGPLRTNVSRNHLNDRVTIHDAAAADVPGEVKFAFVSDDETGWGAITLDKDAPTVAVKAVTLDQICSGIETIDMLKIDTQGAEALVLKGASELLRSHRIRQIFLEIDALCMAKLGIAQEAPLELLRGFGYRCKRDGDGAYAWCLRSDESNCL